MPCRAVPCRAVPFRAVPCRAVQYRAEPSRAEPRGGTGGAAAACRPGAAGRASCAKCPALRGARPVPCWRRGARAGLPAPGSPGAVPLPYRAAEPGCRRPRERRQAGGREPAPLGAPSARCSGAAALTRGRLRAVGTAPAGCCQLGPRRAPGSRAGLGGPVLHARLGRAARTAG